jgi:hypothetical protein
MSKSEKIGLVRYEYIVYIHLLKTYNVREILLTKDDLVDIGSQSNQIEWIPVENMDIDFIDTIGEIGDSSVEGTENRICGLFDAEPLDWRYARITVGDYENTKHCYAIAMVPRSPIVPVVFDINE